MTLEQHNDLLSPLDACTIEQRRSELLREAFFEAYLAVEMMKLTAKGDTVTPQVLTEINRKAEIDFELYLVGEFDMAVLLINFGK